MVHEAQGTNWQSWVPPEGHCSGAKQHELAQGCPGQDSSGVHARPSVAPCFSGQSPHMAFMHNPGTVVFFLNLWSRVVDKEPETQNKSLRLGWTWVKNPRSLSIVRAWGSERC